MKSFVIALLIAAGLVACATVPELGDVRYLDSQQGCLKLNMAEVGGPLLFDRPPTAEEIEELRPMCAAMGYEWTYTIDGLSKRAQALQEVPVAPQIEQSIPISKDSHQASEQASAARPRAAAPSPGETKETAIEMTFEELKLELRAGPVATSDRLTGKWVQLTGRLNGHTGSSGPIGLPGMTDSDLRYSFGIGSIGMYSSLACSSSTGDIKMRDFSAIPIRDVTVVGVYRQLDAVSPRLNSCEVVQDGDDLTPP